MSENDLLYFDSNIEIYWHGVIMAAAILLGCVLFCLLCRIIDRRSANQSYFVTLFSFPLGLILSRAQYCFFRPVEFESFADVLQLTDGGYGLYGAMAGVAAAILLVSIFERTLSLPQLFDAAGVSGALAICVGRLACLFSHEEKGFALSDDRFAKFMFTSFSQSDNSRVVDVFKYESLAAGIIFLALCVTLFLTYGKKKYVRGTAALQFLLLYSLTQTLFESWRSDSLFLNTLGFVRFSQAFSAVIFAVVLVILCIRYAKFCGFNAKQIIIWAALAGLIALAFVCEFTMTGNTRLRNYSGMGAGLLGTLVIGSRLLDRAQLAGAGRKAEPAEDSSGSGK